MMASTTKMLLWKELRRQRSVLIACAIFTGAPYLLFLLIFLIDPTRSDSDFILSGSWTALIICCIISGFFAGNAFAGERPNRSIEFLGCLPITRSADLWSRLLVAGGLSLVVVVVHATIFFVNFTAVEGMKKFFTADMPAMVTGWSGTLLAVFGVSWFGSILLRSPVFAAGSGLIAVVTLGLMGLRVTSTPHLREAQVFWTRTYPMIAVSMGLFGLIAGSLYQLKQTRADGIRTV